MKMTPEIRIGLETHVVLESIKKLFCECKPYSQTCPRCTGFPGFRPNSPPGELIERIGLALRQLKSEPCRQLIFYRKIYPYYDLWKGFQITQHPDNPAGKGGYVKDLNGTIYPLKSVYIEEDPAMTRGKSIDLKRAGTPLLEVVQESAVYTSLDEAVRNLKNYIRSLGRLLRDCGLRDGGGVLKSDINISIDRGPRLEVKNVASLAGLKSILFQAMRVKVTEPSTFHFKSGRLIYSRPKCEYPFVRETHLPVVRFGSAGLAIATFREKYNFLKDLGMVHSQILGDLKYCEGLDFEFKNFKDITFWKKWIFSLKYGKAVMARVEKECGCVEIKDTPGFIALKKRLHEEGVFVSGKDLYTIYKSTD